MILYVLILLLTSGTACSAQAVDAKPIDCKNELFANGRVSTSVCYDKQFRHGLATAFDRLGRVIFQQNLRNGNGQSTVTFTCYTDGAVRRAEWHDNRDDGRWYSSVTLFTPDGRIQHVQQENCNDTLRKRFVPR